MFSNFAIKVENLAKCYQIYKQPHDRLKQFVVPPLQKAFGMQDKRYYREFWALKNVNFEVMKGETIGVIGRNGSGKSTLLQMMCGTLNPTSGLIQTRGRIAALLELGSGFNMEFTGRENVYMNASVLGLKKEEIDRCFHSICEFSEIGDFLNLPVKTYSSGMILRLAFSVAINVKPEILVVDEALAVGDVLFQQKCFSRIEAMKQDGMTLFFVSHSSAQVLDICDRALLLENGELIADGVPKKVVDIYHKVLASPGSYSKQCLDKNDEVVAEKQDKACDLSVFNETTTEYFEKNLQPSSSSVYDQNGALIRSVKILSESGQAVNNLIQGRWYRLRCVVDFFVSAARIRFGMSINSSTGLYLCGIFTAARSSSANVMQQVHAGKSVEVDFLFRCNLTPGVYFVNSGVHGVLDDEEVLMHRIVDVIAFRVHPVAEDGSGGHVWLEIKSSIHDGE